MAPKPITNNTLFYGDNLQILREYIADESVDLTYLDPPFNSNRSYNVLFKDESGHEAESQIEAFDDTWHWNAKTESVYDELVTVTNGEVGALVAALRQALGANQMMAYLVMMAARLVELHRVLKPTGSLYLHCDPTASHYLKVVLDTIFDPTDFKNEIVWERTGSHNSAKRYGPNHDVILFYTRSASYTWNPHYLPHTQNLLEGHYRNQDADGRHFTLSDLTGRGLRHGSSGQAWRGFDPASKGNHWATTVENLDIWDREGRIHWPPKGGWPRYKRYLDEVAGSPLQEVWTDIPPINSQAAERMGYPTQKPIALLERILLASSNPGDVVLDAFGGCGTTIAAAQKLGRRWIGIDITHLAIALQKYRLAEMFPDAQFDVIGEPQDTHDAHKLAQDDRYQFQWWALSLIRARPLGGQGAGKKGKKGSDKGVDGIITFIDDTQGKPGQILVQVKSGHVKSGDVRDLIGTLDREKATMGLFITLEPASRDMDTEAATAGIYHSIHWGDFPRVQILTIEDLLHGRSFKVPPAYGTFKQAGRTDGEAGRQAPLEL